MNSLIFILINDFLVANYITYQLLINKLLTTSNIRVAP
jgi:hypothetical protein